LQHGIHDNVSPRRCIWAAGAQEQFLGRNRNQLIRMFHDSKNRYRHYRFGTNYP